MVTPASQPILTSAHDATCTVSVHEPTLEENLTARPITALFDGAFDLYRRHFLKLSMIVAVGFIPLQIVLHAAVNFWLRPWSVKIDNMDANDQLSQALLIVLGYCFTGYPQYGIPGIFSVLALLILSAPVAVGVAAALHGEPVRVRLAYRRLRRVFFRLLGVWTAAITGSIGIVLGSIFVLSIVLSLVALAFASVAPDAVGYVSVFAMIICPYVLVAGFVARIFLLTSPLIILEGRTVGEIPTRNGQLLKKMKFWKVWAATIAFPLIVLGLRFFVLGGMEFALAAFKLPPTINFAVESLLASLIYFFFEPFWMIFLTLLYFDGRIRRDGYDLYKMAESLEPRRENMP